MPDLKNKIPSHSYQINSTDIDNTSNSSNEIDETDFKELFLKT